MKNLKLSSGIKKMVVTYREVLINSGTTMTTLGREFFVVQEDPTDPLTSSASYAPNGVGYAIARIPGIEAFEVMLRVSGAYTDRNLPSVISGNQICLAGHEVNDSPRRFHGIQAIILDICPIFISLPLEYREGICYLSVRKPDPLELSLFNAVNLTRPERIWTAMGEVWYVDDDEDE